LTRSNFCVLTARVVFFFLAPDWEGVYFYIQLDSDNRDAASEILHVLMEAPSLVYIALFSQQVLVWAEAYFVGRNEMGLYNSHAWPAVVCANVLVVLVQVTLWLVNATYPRSDPRALSLTTAVLNAVVFSSVTVVMTVLGVALNRSVASAPLDLLQRSASVRSVTTLNVICGVAFVLRAVALAIIAYVAFIDLGGFDDKADPEDTALDAFFFVATELVPLAAILFFHRPRARLRRKAAKSPRGGHLDDASNYASPQSPGRISAALQTLRFSISPRSDDGSEAADDDSSALNSQTERKRTNTASAVWALLSLLVVGVSVGGGSSSGGGGGNGSSEKSRLLATTTKSDGGRGGSYGAVVELVGDDDREAASKSLENARAGAVIGHG
jgi:hypothetical protein